MPSAVCPAALPTARDDGGLQVARGLGGTHGQIVCFRHGPDGRTELRAAQPKRLVMTTPLLHLVAGERPGVPDEYRHDACRDPKGYPFHAGHVTSFSCSM